MYKRRRVNTDTDMEDSQEPGSSISTTSTPTTTAPTNDSPNTPNSDKWDSDEEQDDNTSNPDTFNTAKFTTEEPETTTPSTEALFRTLRRIKGKTIQCQHHITNMENHIMKGSCPKGLEIRLQPNVPTIDTVLIREWERLNLNHQAKLILCIRDYWKRHHQNLLDQCKNLEDELQTTVTPSEWKKMTEQIEKTMEATQNNYSRPRRRRDQEGSSKGKPGRS
jgi:hypothetical protein